MAASDAPRRNWVVGLLGLVGFGAVAGTLVTVTVAPAVALTGIAASSAIGIFDGIPNYFELGELPERNEIYAHNNDGWELVATVYDQNREEVSYDEISEFAVDATIAGEDKRYYEHGGIDPAGVIRAAIDNVTSGGIESGASTIAMQLVKNTYVQEAFEKDTEEERQAAYEEATATSFDRKLKEMKIAISLEKRYTKKEILTAYLNVAYFGQQTYGVQAASQRYFGVDASDLTLAQAASLIAIVQYPEARNPLNDVDDPEGTAERWAANQDRRDYILGVMLEEGYITQEQYDEAVAIPVDAAFVAGGQVPQQGCRTANGYARWFCDYVVKSVKDFEFLGETEQEREEAWARGGYQLYTTLDMNAQLAAQTALWTYTPPSYNEYALGSAVSTVEPGTGKVRVMVQNKIFDDALEPDDPTTSTAVNFNVSVSYGGGTGFQPGSTYKLFTLVQWLVTGHGVNAVVNGSEGTIAANQWSDRCTGAGADTKVVNDGHESGSYTVRQGTWQSINGVFLRMATKMDLCDINELAASMGVVRGDETTLVNNPASVIGTNEVAPLSMAVAYATVAAGGKMCEPIVVESYVGPDGEMHVGQESQCSQVIDPDIAATVADVLVGNTSNGTGTQSDPGDGIPMMSKTGTTDSAEQTWVAASTTTNATIVWVGNITGHYAQSEFRYVRHDIMRDTMAALNSKFGGSAFPTPSGKYLEGGRTSVPSVANLGLTYERAKSVLEAAGFTVADGGDWDSDQPLGTIVQQSPEGGSLVGEGETVTLYKSRQNMAAVPNVTGLTVSSAQSTLGGSGFTVGSVFIECPTGYELTPSAPASLPAGDVSGRTVLRQSPDGGQLAILGSSVNLAVSLDASSSYCQATPAPTPTPTTP